MEGRLKLFREIVETPPGGIPFKDKEDQKVLKGYSFIVKSETKVFVDGREHKLWFKSEAAARGCADDIMRKVLEGLKAQGIRAEGFTQ